LHGASPHCSPATCRRGEGEEVHGLSFVRLRPDPLIAAATSIFSHPLHSSLVRLGDQAMTATKVG
jgi:hypothetical protein